jgi:hypothetical protein
MSFAETAKATDAQSASLVAGAGSTENMTIRGDYTVECFDAEGNLKWSEGFKNLVVTVGKNFMLDETFSGTNYSAAWYLGLVDGASSPTYNAADTMASHAGWSEFTSYSESTRPSPTWSSASAGSKATTATSFSINGSGTVAGAFMTTNNTKSGTTGTLFSAGNFSGGSRTVASGDTLNVTWTATLT